MMYICSKCGRTTETLATSREVHSECDNYCYETIVYYDCGCGGEYDIAEKCAICGEWIHPDTDYGVCAECVADSYDVDTMIRYIDDTQLAKEFFVEWWLWSDCNSISTELLELCRYDWNNAIKCDLRKADAKARLIEFIKCDFGAYLDWVSDNK